MFHRWMFARALVALLAFTALLAPSHAIPTMYRAGFARWRAAEGGFAGWQQSGTLVGSDGALRVASATALPGTDPYPPGGYSGGNFYNGGSFFVGEAVGPVTAASFGFRQAIVSWNAETPAGTWIETQLRANISGRWTKWYNLGVWASDGSTVARHSVSGQGDGDGTVSVDTVVLSAKKTAGSAFQVKLRLFSETVGATPLVRNAGVAYSTTPSAPDALVAGDPSRWNRSLAVPECSQMVYPDGGNVWCSPTSTSMVLAYWQGATGACEPRVRAAVEGTYDWIYDGHGNWPFCAAYPGAQGLEAYVARFTSLAQAEAWIAAGVPVVLSYGWGVGDLDGAPVPSSNGHLTVLVGFDADGDPIINDPAAANDADVQRTYRRDQIEPLWLGHSGGTVYLIYPAGTPTPSL